MYVIIISSAIIFVLLVVLILSMFGSGTTETYHRRRCPVCNRRLEQGERVYADEIKRSSRPNQLKIKGCTHCYEGQ